MQLTSLIILILLSLSLLNPRSTLRLGRGEGKRVSGSKSISSGGKSGDVGSKTIESASRVSEGEGKNRQTQTNYVGDIRINRILQLTQLDHIRTIEQYKENEGLVCERILKYFQDFICTLPGGILAIADQPKIAKYIQLMENILTLSASKVVDLGHWDNPLTYQDVIYFMDTLIARYKFMPSAYNFSNLIISTKEFLFRHFTSTYSDILTPGQINELFTKANINERVLVD